MDELKLYIADLAAYNSGKLIGEWVTLSDFESWEELSNYIQKNILKMGEEWAVHDYELPFRLNSEWPDMEALLEFSHMWEGWNDYERIGALAFIEHEGFEYRDTLYQVVEDGEFTIIELEGKSKERTVGEYWLYDSGIYDLSELGEFERFIDIEAYGREQLISGNYLEVEYDDNKYLVELRY